MFGGGTEAAPHVIFPGNGQGLLGTRYPEYQTPWRVVVADSLPLTNGETEAWRHGPPPRS